MTAKRFTLMSVVNLDYGINDNGKSIGSLSNICDLLNKLNDENEQLKNGVHSSYYEHKRIVNSYCDKIKELEKENEQLKQQLNYIQNSISEHIKHQKTELGQKALKEIIEDYNEWLLGHKELKE